MQAEIPSGGLGGGQRGITPRVLDSEGGAGSDDCDRRYSDTVECGDVIVMPSQLLLSLGQVDLFGLVVRTTKITHFPKTCYNFIDF